MIFLNIQIGEIEMATKQQLNLLNLTRINRKSFFAFPPRFKYNKENIGGCIHVTYG